MFLLLGIALESALRRVELLGMAGESVFQDGYSATCHACHTVVDDLMLAVDDLYPLIDDQKGTAKVREVVDPSRCLKAMAEYDLAELDHGHQIVRRRRGSAYARVGSEVNEWVKFELQEFCASLVSEHRDQVRARSSR